MGNASQYFPIKDKLFTEINMSLKGLGIVVFISIFMVQGNEAATATCEFGPMDGVEEDIKGHITFRQADAASSLSINVRGIEGLKTGFHGFHIHENGNCSDPGSHLNPEGRKHGYNQDTSRDYHVGDFGNIPVIQGIHFMKSLLFRVSWLVYLMKAPTRSLEEPIFF